MNLFTYSAVLLQRNCQFMRVKISGPDGDASWLASVADWPSEEWSSTRT